MNSVAQKVLLGLTFAACSGAVVQAAPCTALATFYGEVVQATGVDVKSATLKQEMTDIQSSGKACAQAIARMADARSYTHEIGAPLTRLRSYLEDDARFADRVVGGGEKVEAIQFDVEAVAVLRRRPTR